MKAVAYFQNLPLSAPESLLDLELPRPTRARATCWSRCAPLPSTRLM